MGLHLTGPTPGQTLSECVVTPLCVLVVRYNITLLQRNIDLEFVRQIVQVYASNSAWLTW